MAVSPNDVLCTLPNHTPIKAHNDASSRDIGGLYRPTLDIARKVRLVAHSQESEKPMIRSASGNEDSGGALVAQCRSRRLRSQVKKLATDLQAGRPPGDWLQGVCAVVYEARLSNPRAGEVKRGGFREARRERAAGIILPAICKRRNCAEPEPANDCRALKELSLIP